MVRLLTQRGKTLSVAESCSGGLLANRITDIPGSSNVLHLGIVAYDNRAKIKILKIPSKIISRYGAVSTQVARLMASNVRKILKTDIGIGITGIAGPTGGTKDKPVGLVYVALSTKNKVVCRRLNLKGQRASIKLQATTEALKLLMQTLSK